MDQHVSWIIEVALKDGALDAYTELMEEMVSGTGTEPQTLAYEWYISADKRTVHIFEKYATSESMVSHVSGFLEKWAARFMACVDVTRFVVYGDPSPEARALLEGFGPVYLGPWGGFSRIGES
jgi:quinol monooxygenase YgiN